LFHRKYDYESYLATLLIRKDLKRTGFALRAFNVELAQVFDLTSTPTTARGRFMFWTSAVEDIYSSQKSAAFDNNPVIAELRRVIIALRLRTI
jgi:NADH dehydrogenase [ubiquinone] 1 alpha subcomplex assembly factor 6